MAIHKTKIVEQPIIKYEKDDFINKIIKLLVKGYTHHQIHQSLIKDEYKWGSDLWSKTKRYAYINEAYQEIKENLTAKKEDLANRVLTMFFDIYADSKKAKDRQSQIKALAEIKKLTGLDEPEKIDITQDISVNINFNTKTPIFENNDEDEEE